MILSYLRVIVTTVYLPNPKSGAGQINKDLGIFEQTFSSCSTS
jgi:hypothetical protein